jgi:hypothetical protein
MFERQLRLKKAARADHPVWKTVTGYDVHQRPQEMRDKMLE